ncbi:ATP-grasp domain-containing protein [Xanthomonas albilineans]|uniref:Putative carbamoyl-phosphate synthase, cpsase protein n=1 Tax=Xanthomonas albilineans (strain GPE PC73 / CFBP 7063) TaxID=380358 RepID=D2U9J6_XANAP|nr:ATP-grasp domain-containing protein [Xanthomonas albilineans]QHQ29185.1 putative carbamoyl-phosphate synthase cpsase protein [Xanthomonas albilineans]CBA16948.1 putative carbamoyl-phosphate synthase, cpsase protein [Xanthomonas albilineans GPE PC73]
MARLLMLDSWVYATGITVPLAIRELGHTYTLLTPNPSRFKNNPLGDGIHPVIAEAEAVVVANVNDDTTLLETARRLHEQSRFDAVITSCDHYLIAAARVAEMLELPTVGSNVVRTTRDKYLMRLASCSAGVPTPQFGIAATHQEALAIAQRIGYPVVVKPTDMSASAFVALAMTDAELLSATDAVTCYRQNARGQDLNAVALIEEFLDGQEVSVETVTVNGATQVIAVTDKSLYSDTLFIETGHMVPAILDPETVRAVGDLAEAALRAVGYSHGVAHTEIKLTSRGPRVVEINPRVGGNWISELVRITVGFDLIQAFVKLSLGATDLSDCFLAPVARSAAIQFLLPPSPGILAGVSNWDEIVSDPYVHRSHLDPFMRGKKVAAPKNNDSYLAHVLCIDRAGVDARAHCERLVAAIELTYLERH